MNRLQWEREAQWIYDHLPEMHFSLNEVRTIFSVSMPGDDDVRHLTSIMTDLFGAYSTGPCCSTSYSAGDRVYNPFQSFGFWNYELIENARRVFPSLRDLRPSPMRFVGPQPTPGEWDRLREVYDRLPGDLPRTYDDNQHQALLEHLREDQQYRAWFEELLEVYRDRSGKQRYKLLVVLMQGVPHRVTYMNVDAVGITLNAERGIASYADWRKGDRYKRLADLLLWIDLPDGYCAPVMKSSGSAVWEVDPPRMESGQKPARRMNG